MEQQNRDRAARRAEVERLAKPRGGGGLTPMG